MRQKNPNFEVHSGGYGEENREVPSPILSSAAFSSSSPDMAITKEGNRNLKVFLFRLWFFLTFVNNYRPKKESIVPVIYIQTNSIVYIKKKGKNERGKLDICNNREN